MAELTSNRVKNYLGGKVGKLTIVEFIRVDSKSGAIWRCSCDCGGEVFVSGGELGRPQRSILPKSCGCSQRGSAANLRKTHGLTNSVEYRTWSDMKNRCYNKKCREYKRYGARGISVCDRWLNSFSNFYQDIGQRPSASHSIERIDNDGNYEPSNCRWAYNHEQQWNRRDSIIVVYMGVNMSLGRLAKITGVSRYALRSRIVKSGMTAEDAVLIG